MKGLVFPGGRRVEFRDFADPRPGPVDALVEMKSSGLCGSDLHSYRAEEPRQEPLHVCGHEPCGIVREVGSAVPPRWVGRRVMVHHYRGCGECRNCLIGYTQMCVHGNVVYGSSGDGGNAPWLCVPASTLVPLPDSLSYAAGAAIACGTGTAYMAVKRLAVSGRDTLAVFGQGPVGLSATMLATAMGARVIAVDVTAARLSQARELGSWKTVDASQGDSVAAIRELTGGYGAETALDATGNAIARRQACQCAADWGRVCWVGERGTVTLEPTPDVIHKQLTLYGSWTFSIPGLAEAAQFIADRNVPIEKLITHRYKLEQAEEAFRTFDAGETGKCVFVWDD